MHGKDIKNYFVINNKNYDCCVTVSLEGVNKEVMKHILENIFIDVDSTLYEFAAYCPDENTRTLERRIFVRKIDDRKD